MEDFYIKATAPQAGNKPQQQPSTPSTEDGLVVPSALADGVYRIVPSTQQLTEAGRVYVSNGQLQYWAYGTNAVATLDLTNSSFKTLVTTLSYNCSFTVKGSVVTAITVRPSTVERKPSVDVSKVNTGLIGDIPVTFSITSKQSKEAGGVTPGGTTVTVSASLLTWKLDLGQYQLNDNSTPGFATIEGSLLTFDPQAALGSQLVINIKQSGGTMKTLRIEKKTENTYTFAYED